VLFSRIIPPGSPPISSSGKNEISYVKPCRLMSVIRLSFKCRNAQLLQTMTKSWCFSSERPMVDPQPGPRNLGLSLVVCPTWYCISTAQTVVLAKRKFSFNGHGRRETQGVGSSARPRTESQCQERAEVWQTKFEPTENQRPWKFRPPASPISILPTRGVKGKEVSPLPTGRMVELAHNRPNMSAAFAA
jgi:hypothetical protein